jgi:hypothetical protein
MVNKRLKEGIFVNSIISLQDTNFKEPSMLENQQLHN